MIVGTTTVVFVSTNESLNVIVRVEPDPVSLDALTSGVAKPTTNKPININEMNFLFTFITYCSSSWVSVCHLANDLNDPLKDHKNHYDWQKRKNQCGYF
ncbi:hypothetical protein KAU43_07710 [candidate division WOR-3 bacterium]|nr:hypothetical protein [candidate division WOR-3 bacterium]